MTRCVHTRRGAPAYVFMDEIMDPREVEDAMTDAEVKCADTGTPALSTAPFVCSMPGCGKEFKDRKGLTRHLPVHSANREHVCGIQGCGKAFLRAGQLRVHYKSHGLGPDGKSPLPKEFACPEDGCVEAFESKALLRKHAKAHMDPRQYACTTCGERFHKAYQQKEHMFGHDAEPRFRCSVVECAKLFGLRRELRKHHTMVHDPKRNVCTIDGCDQVFVRFPDLRKHMKDDHPDRFACTVCGLVLTRAAALRKHMVTHDESRERFSCSVCQKGFVTQKGLTEHMNGQHLGILPYKCSMCDEAFANGAHLHFHKKKHLPNYEEERKQRLAAAAEKRALRMLAGGGKPGSKRKREEDVATTNEGPGVHVAEMISSVERKVQDSKTVGGPVLVVPGAGAGAGSARPVVVNKAKPVPVPALVSASRISFALPAVNSQTSRLSQTGASDAALKPAVPKVRKLLASSC